VISHGVSDTGLPTIGLTSPLLQHFSFPLRLRVLPPRNVLGYNNWFGYRRYKLETRVKCQVPSSVDSGGAPRGHRWATSHP